MSNWGPLIFSLFLLAAAMYFNSRESAPEIQTAHIKLEDKYYLCERIPNHDPKMLVLDCNNN